MKHFLYFLVGAVIIAGLYIFVSADKIDLPKGETVVVEDPEVTIEPTGESAIVIDTKSKTNRIILETDGVRHSVPLDEIRQGCFGRDCIPSVDAPEFISIAEADVILNGVESLGIGIEINGEKRFYPFLMLVTREIVNDTIAGEPVLVTYCPLCGTGIVFERKLDDVAVEFGVSGFLWQSNLLMYNRGVADDEITLFSQVLGEGVLGPKTSTKLKILPSSVVFYDEWKKENPDSLVLNTGGISDPYGGDYYRVAKGFNPDFDESNSLLSPTEYVLGIEINGMYKAYRRDGLKVGETTDSFEGRDIAISKNSNNIIEIRDEGTGDLMPVITGFWFSWVAAHPDTDLLN